MRIVQTKTSLARVGFAPTGNHCTVSVNQLPCRLTSPAPELCSAHQKITSSLDCPAFIDAHRQHPQDFTRRRQLTFKNLVLFLLNQPRTALQTELDQFYRVLNTVWT